jgi:hypothetical protein
MPESDPYVPTHDLVERDAHVDVVLRGRPRLETVVALFAELERLTSAESELLVLVDESEIYPEAVGNTELRNMMGAWLESDGLRNQSRIAIYAPSHLVNGLALMVQAFGGGPADHRLMVFRSRRAARNWLLGDTPARPHGLAGQAMDGRG